MSKGHIVGWAYDSVRPDEPVELEFRLDGVDLGRCVAEVERVDLRRKGIGDGRHGFRVPLGRALESGGTYRIAVRASVDGTLLPLVAGYLSDGGGAGSEPVVLTLDQGPASVEGPSSPVLHGTGGWLFPDDGPATLARSLGAAAADPAAVWDAVGRLRERHERCASLGVEYLAVATPPKAVVYADHLPDLAGGPQVPALSLAGRPAARLAAALRDEPRAELLDLFPVLRDARRDGRLFTRLGAGLTWKGAFHAYRAIAKELGKRVPSVAPPPVDQLTLGDLVPTEDSLDRAQPPEFEPALGRGRLHARQVALPPDLADRLPGGALVFASPAERAAPLTALVLMEAPVPRVAVFLAEHFASTIVSEWSGPADELLGHVSPDVLVQILADGGELLV